MKTGVGFLDFSAAFSTRAHIKRRKGNSLKRLKSHFHIQILTVEHAHVEALFHGEPNSSKLFNVNICVSMI